MRRSIPTYTEDGSSRFFRNVGSTYQATRHYFPNGRVFTLTAMITLVLQAAKLFSVATFYRLCPHSHATALVATIISAFDVTKNGLIWTAP
jgi:hypothetical protein